MKTSLVLSILLLFAAGHCQPAMAQSEGNFAATATMTTPRWVHTATLLLDGRVLVAGGQNSSAPALSGTEIYDPSTQTFTASGSMTVARTGHTATLLADGRVLIVGGDAMGTAEIYDPSTGGFTGTGGPAIVRNAANATLLGTGKVLFTGSFCDCPFPGAELYDPSTGLFMSAGSYAGNFASVTEMAEDFGSTSTLLPDGTVLFGAEPAAQVYDPVSNTFSLRGPLLAVDWFGNTFAPTYIAGQSANLLLDGRVLLAGGEDDYGRFSNAQLYGSASSLFVPTGSMTTPRVYHSATLLPDGRVLIAGGESQNCGTNSCWFTESSAELYDPVAGVFSIAGNMTTPRESQTATLLNSGDVLIAGGVTSTSQSAPVLASAELYHPAAPIPAPSLFLLSDDGGTQGAVWHATTGQPASPQTPASPGEILAMYVSGLAEGGTIPPQVTVGGQLAEILYFGDAPGYPGYFQINFEVPDDVTAGDAVAVHLRYLGRSSNAVTIATR
jgi:uncharacterized protein (TIGR03437 family)